MAQGTRDWSRKRPLVRYTTGDDVDELFYRIDQRMNDIIAEVDATSASIQNTITSTASDIESTINNTASDIQTTVNNAASNIQSTVETTAANIQNTIETTASETSDAIVSIVTDTMHRLGEYAHTYPTGRIVQRILCDSWSKGAYIVAAGSDYSYEEYLMTARYSSAVLYLIPATTGTTYVELTVNFPALYSGRIGVEINYAMPYPTAECYIRIVRRDAVYNRIFVLRHNHNDRLLQLFASTGTWQTIRTLNDIPVNANLFHSMKLVIDTHTNYYQRARFDEFDFDISSYNHYTSISTSVRDLTIGAGTGRYLGANSGILLDSMIITTNEE